MDKNYSFNLLESGFQFSAEQKEFLMKWGLDKTMNKHKFTFDQSYQHYELDNLLKCLFRDQNVARSIAISGFEVESVKYEPITCKHTTLDLFNTLKQGSIAPVRNDGSINGCFPDKILDVNCETELHMALVNEDSDQYCIFSDEERKEFLYLIFQLIVIGGSLCQYENNIQPYLDMTRALYKSLVTVYRNKSAGDSTNSATPKFEVSSKVYKVTAVFDKEGTESFYPAASWKEEHIQTVCYVIVDAEKRHVTLFTNKYIPFW